MIRLAFEIVLLTALIFCGGCKRSVIVDGNEDKLLSGAWQSLGLEGKLVPRLVLANDFLYACAGRDGLFRLELKAQNPEWQYLGLADSAVERAPELGVTDAVSLDSVLLVSYVANYQLQKRGVYRSTDDGTTWQPSDSGLHVWSPEYPFTSRVLSLESSPQSTNVILASLWFSIYKSTDTGRTWRLVDGNPEAGSSIYTLKFNLSDPNKVWAGEETGFFAPWLRRSTDGGETWDHIRIPPIGPLGQDNAVFDIAVDPINDGTVYLAMIGIILKTADNAATWQQVDSRTGGSYRIELNPDNPQELFATGGYLYHTTDGASSWSKILPPEGGNYIYALAMDWRQRVLYVSVSSSENGIYKMQI